MAMPQVPVQATFLGPLGAVSAIWMKFFQALVSVAQVRIQDAPTITIDAGRGSVFDVTLGGNRTLAAPVSGTDGQTIRLRIRQDGAGSRTVTWNAAFHFGTTGAPTLTTAPGKTDFVDCTYNAGNAAWECLAYVRGY